MQDLLPFPMQMDIHTNNCYYEFEFMTYYIYNDNISTIQTKA